MFKYLIQSKKIGDNTIPAQDFGYTYLNSVEFLNWWHDTDDYSAELIVGTDFQNRHLQTNVIPVGSVEFCLEWYKRMGVFGIRPINVPDCLLPMLKRKYRTHTRQISDGKWYAKSEMKIKSHLNGLYTGPQEFPEDMFLTECVDDIESEWRLFVYKGGIVDIRCYAGDAWLLPDRDYCREAASIYGQENNSFTLDVFVDSKCQTDILECHDFFACGLYGFDNPTYLRAMAIQTQMKLLGNIPTISFIERS